MSDESSFHPPTDEELTEAVLIQMSEAKDPNETKDPNVIEVDTLFFVYRDKNGTWMAEADLTKPFAPERVANNNDFFDGANTIIRDMNASAAAFRVVMLLQQQAQQALAAQQTDQIRRVLSGGVPLGADGRPIMPSR